MDKIKVGIIGATGYAGAELARLLLSHPYAEIAALGSVSYEGKKMSDVYPNLYGACDIVLTGEDAVIEASDVVFASLPHGLSEEIAAKCLEKGVKLIDLGADFRLSDPAEYKEWYGLEYKRPELHDKSVYIIPELMRARYNGQPIIANPGCYPTSAALALAPMAADGNIAENGVIIDSKSGVTGAGRGLTQTSHFPDCNEAFAPYKIAAHRHTPEIEQTLRMIGGRDIKISFTPHLLPLNRGIVSTCYVTPIRELDIDKVYDMYTEFYADERFVRVLPLGAAANLKNVRLSNYCDISLHVDKRANRLIVVAAIDNMVKGAAGQAIQNMNLMFSIDESAGLELYAPAF